jgi:hypothetical protein
MEPEQQQSERDMPEQEEPKRLMQQVIPWEEMDLETQRDEYERQALAWEYRELMKDWARNYTRLARALADSFGEEEVLDILEKSWWDLEYTAGSTWREDFEEDPYAAFDMLRDYMHDGPQSLTSGAVDLQREKGHWELLHQYCYHKEVALEMDERKIGISWCMADAAAVRGWSPRAVLDFANSQLRGDHYCYHIRRIVEDADPELDHWSRDKSEKIGWRSIKKLEEA